MTKYILIAAGVAIAIAGGAAWWQYQVAAGLRDDLAVSRANVMRAREAVLEANASVTRLEHMRTADQAAINNLAGLNDAAIRARDQAVAKYNEYRTRLGRAALAKPGLVARRATRATLDLMQQFERATDRGRKARGTDRAIPSAAAAGRAGDAGRGGGTDAGGDGGAK